jgi:nanoRNase/pAp phosphatase (c-di-AMP/oligoRNAs hydrolase)
MPLNPAALRLLEKAHTVAIFPLSPEDTDGIASGLALVHVLESHGIEATIFPGNTPAARLSFLGKSESVQPSFSIKNKLVITVPAGTAGISGLSYERRDDALEIHVAPKKGALEPRGVRAELKTSAQFDLIITLGASNLQKLGQRFLGATDFFYTTPILNIDYHAENTSYGKVNIIDWNARTIAEIVTTLIEQYDASALTGPVATCLLAALMGQTESFQREMTSPQQFELGARLIDLGGQRYEIVHNLFKTKPMPHLKLLGRILAAMQPASKNHVLWAMVDEEDFKLSQTTIDHLPDLIATSLLPATQAAAIFLFVKTGQKTIRVFLATPNSDQATAMLMRCAPAGSVVRGQEQVATTDLTSDRSDGTIQEILRQCELFLAPRYTEQQSHDRRHSPIDPPNSRPGPAKWPTPKLAAPSRNAERAFDTQKV